VREWSFFDSDRPKLSVRVLGDFSLTFGLQFAIVVPMSQDHAVILQCSKCKERNYNTTRNRKSEPEKLSLKKYCNTCRKSNLHKEIKIGAGAKK
jgi:large subunit ribosomal protein L33